MNQNKKRIVENELAVEMSIYKKLGMEIMLGANTEINVHNVQVAKEKIKSIMFDLWENGDITISFN